MLYRFREAMMVEAGLKRHPKDKTPLLPATTTSIPFAEQARRDLLKEINRKIARTQNPDAELPVIRTANDEINDLIGQVRAWDERIRELGGLSRRSQRRIEEFEAAAGAEQGETVQIDGKFYFGRAKELPEAQEFLSRREAIDKEATETRELKAQQAKMYAQVDQEYYGKLEADETAAIEEELQEFNTLLEKEGGGVMKDWVTGLPVTGRLPFVDEPSAEEAQEIDKLLASVPKQSEIEAFLLERRKQELLKRYTQ